ncbi:GSCOCG00000079001-RA-CDS [Cotesia congregata]|nr:GSCOCG00000079001-RA-CDS [Cotesia congregata]
MNTSFAGNTISQYKWHLRYEFDFVFILWRSGPFHQMLCPLHCYLFIQRKIARSYKKLFTIGCNVCYPIFTFIMDHI